MRPTTSTNNSKTSGKPFEKLRSWVPLSEIKIQFNNLTKFLRLVVSVVLPTQDIILNEIAARRVKFGFEILVLERKFVNREGKWNWLLSPPWLRMEQRIYVKLWQVGPYSYLRNFPELWETEGRRPADLLIGNGNTNLRDASYEITKPNPLLIEKSHVADTKEGSVNLIDWERDDRKREKLYDTLQLKLLEGRYANS
jgi:hypothetical protein